MNIEFSAAMTSIASIAFLGILGLAGALFFFRLVKHVVARITFDEIGTLRAPSSLAIASILVEIRKVHLVTPALSAVKETPTPSTDLTEN